MEIENLTLNGGLTFTTGEDYSVIVVWDISDQTGVLPQCGPGGWYTENDGRTVGFLVQDSQNCGGCNPNIQRGNAVATFSVGNFGYNLEYELTGLGERQDTGYENMKMFLTGGNTYNNTQMVFATSPGGKLGCASGAPVVQSVYVPPPIWLKPNTQYTFRCQFNTADPLYHINCYYELILKFSR